jgi:hypothetical protein
VRQLWTDRQLPLAHIDADLMALAVLLSAEAELGAGRTGAVEVWHLRDGDRRLWSRDKLLLEAIRLKQRLDNVAAELIGVQSQPVGERSTSDLYVGVPWSPAGRASDR